MVLVKQEKETFVNVLKSTIFDVSKCFVDGIVRIDGLLGITLDTGEVFLISLSEVLLEKGNDYINSAAVFDNSNSSAHSANDVSNEMLPNEDSYLLENSPPLTNFECVDAVDQNANNKFIGYCSSNGGDDSSLFPEDNAFQRLDTVDNDRPIAKKKSCDQLAQITGNCDSTSDDESEIFIGIGYVEDIRCSTDNNSGDICRMVQENLTHLHSLARENEHSSLVVSNADNEANYCFSKSSVFPVITMLSSELSFDLNNIKEEPRDDFNSYGTQSNGHGLSPVCIGSIIYKDASKSEVNGRNRSRKILNRPPLHVQNLQTKAARTESHSKNTRLRDNRKRDYLKTDVCAEMSLAI